MRKRGIIYIFLLVLFLYILIIGAVSGSPIKNENKNALNLTGKYDHQVEFACEIVEIINEEERYIDGILQYTVDYVLKMSTPFSDVLKEGDSLELHSGLFTVEKDKKKGPPKVGDIVYITFEENLLQEKGGLYIIENGIITALFPSVSY